MKLASASEMMAVLPLLLLSFTVSAPAQTSAAELDLGITAYKNSHYEEAVRHFQKATELDDGNIRAHLYLATAYVSQYIPGVDTVDNLRMAEGGIEQYQHVLNSDADHEQKTNSAKGIAYLYLNTKKFEEAKDYYQKASAFDPKDPEPYYSVGVIDWTRCYRSRMEVRAQLGLRPEQNLNGRVPAQLAACRELQTKNMAFIEEGIDNLNKAIDLRPDYDDAMAYLNLMYRERADLECDNLSARRQDLKAADDWVDKTLATKKEKAEKQEPLQR